MDATAARYVEAAYEDHGSGLERRLAALTRDQAAGQDLAQDAFYRLARQVDLGHPPDDVGAWLHRVGTNLAMSRGRHLQVVARRQGRLPRPIEPTTPEAIAIDGERRALMRSMFLQLTGTEQRALALAAYGVGGIQTAAAIGRTPAATRTLICRARAKLRRQLERT